MPIEYNPGDVLISSSSEHIRMRPELYVGPLPNPRIVNRLVEEVLCLSVDDALCGRCTEITVAVNPAGMITVRDNGPGLPMEPDCHGRVMAELLLTVVGACRAAKQSDAAKGGCCHLGLVVANCLCEWLRLRVFRDGGCWIQEYCDGIAQAPFHREADANETGLEFSFIPDIGILGTVEFDVMTLATWLSSAGLQFELSDYHPGNASSVVTSLLHFKAIRPCKA